MACDHRCPEAANQQRDHRKNARLGKYRNAEDAGKSARGAGIVQRAGSPRWHHKAAHSAIQGHGLFGQGVPSEALDEHLSVLGNPEALEAALAD